MDINSYELTKTGDGSFTLYNKQYKQHYHSTKDGAILESLHKHILPALSHHKDKEHLKILDICFGLGYNSFLTILQNLHSSQPKTIHIYSPELDLKLLHSLKNFEYPSIFKPISHIIEAISNHQYYQDRYHTIEVFVGDAREYLHTLESSSFDVIYQDAFSSDVNKELWSKEYFEEIYRLCDAQVILTTYSVATSVRLSMKEAKFFIYEYKPELTNKITLAYKLPQPNLKEINLAHKLQLNPNIQMILDSNS